MCFFIIPMMNRMVSEIRSNILLGKKYLSCVLVLLPSNFISGFKLHQNYTSLVSICLCCYHWSKKNKKTSVSTSKLDFGSLTKFWHASNLEKGSLNKNYKLYITERKNSKTNRKDFDELQNRSTFNLPAYFKG